MHWTVEVLLAALLLRGCLVHSSAAFSSLHARVVSSTGSLIVNFREEIETLASSSFEDSVDDDDDITEVDLQLLHATYMGKLRDIYLKKFLSEMSSKGTLLSLSELRRRTVEDCRLAMEASTPAAHLADWDFSAYINELEADIARYVEDVAEASESAEQRLSRPMQEASSSSDEKKRKKRDGFQQTIWFKRSKWLASQLLLLSLNMLQSEWHRRATRRAAEKRLAEVPEFPLL